MWTRLLPSLALMSFLTTTAAATVIHVDVNGSGDYLTIQDGIDAASVGDTVLVAAGTYSGVGNSGISFHGKNIVVVSESGADVTVVDCGGRARAFTFTEGEEAQARLQGFTLTGGISDRGGAVYINGSSPRIADCRFVSNSASVRGGGLSCYNSSSVISDCSFTGNTAGFGGGLRASGSATILRCTFSDNVASWAGGGVSLSGSELVVSECAFVGNSAANGGGLSFVGGPEIVGCTFVGNTASEAGGGLWRFYSHNDRHTIDSCTFVFNEADAGSGMGLEAPYGTITQTIVAFSRGGRGIDCSGLTSDHEVYYCCFFENEGGDEIGGYCGDSHDNLFEDPLLCDVDSGDLALCQNSPCVFMIPEFPYVAIVGASFYGCGDCDSPVEQLSWGSIKALYR